MNSTLLLITTTQLSIRLDKCGWPWVNNEDAFEIMSPVSDLNLVLYPFLLALCLFGNFFNIFVLMSEKPGGPKDVYLIAIAVFDVVYM